MKWHIPIFTIILLICIYSAYAVELTCEVRPICAENQTEFFRMSDTTNSHVQLTGIQNYSDEIVYYSFDTNFSICNGCVNGDKLFNQVTSASPYNLTIATYNESSFNYLSYSGQGLFCFQNTTATNTTRVYSTNGNGLYSAKPLEARTYSIWAKWEGPIGNKYPIYSEGNCLGWYIRIYKNDSTANNYAVLNFQTSQNASFDTPAGCTNYTSRSITLKGFNVSEWHNYIAVFNRTEGYMSFYVDGKYYGNTSINSGAMNNTLSAGTYNTLRIGGDWNFATMFYGYLDEVRIWNRSLSQEEIVSNYNRARVYNYGLCCNTSSLLTNASDGTIIGRLSSHTNAHIQTSDYSTYTYPIYIQSNIPPTCTVTTGACASSYSCVYSLSSGTNAHAGVCSAYTTNICCKINDKYPQTPNLTFTPESPQNNITPITAFCDGVLYRNEINVTSIENAIPTILPVGIHNYSCQLPENTTHYAGETNLTYTITEYIPEGSTGGGGGGGGATPYYNCTYYLDKQTYVANENITLSFSCPSDFNRLYSVYIKIGEYPIFIDEGQITKLNQTVVFTATKPGLVIFKINGIEKFSMPFFIELVDQSTLGYLQMILLGIVILAIILYIALSSEKRPFTKTELYIEYILLISAIVLGGTLLILTKQEGYLYMALLGIVIIGSVWVLNYLIRKEEERKRKWK